MILIKNIAVAAIVILGWWQFAERSSPGQEWLFASSVPFVFLGFLWASWRISLSYATRTWLIVAKVVFAVIMTGAITLAFFMNLPQCPTIECIEAPK